MYVLLYLAVALPCQMSASRFSSSYLLNPYHRGPKEKATQGQPIACLVSVPIQAPLAFALHRQYGPDFYTPPRAFRDLVAEGGWRQKRTLL